MADPVSLALGITPLVLSVLQGIQATRSKLKTLRHHDRVMKRLRRNFTTQSHIFLDECHLLLQQIIDPDDVVFMLENDQSSLWKEPSLDMKIKYYLGRKFEDVKEIMEEIRSQITLLDERLNRTAPGDSREVKLTKTEKVREACDVMAHKTDLEANIEQIKELNHEFKRLRKMAHEVKKAQTLARAHEPKQMPKDYRVRGEHARSFYNALKYCWSCSERHTAQHYLALILGLTDGFDMRVILYRPESQLLDLLVRPQQLLSAGLVLPPAKRVRYGEGDCSKKKPLDLRRSQNVCDSLAQLGTAPLDTCFIDTPDSFRHELTVMHELGKRNKPEVTAIPLQNILSKGSLDVDLTVTQQLRLILKIARAHLQYHWTPWWKQYWMLTDLFYFEEVGLDTDMAACLKTLHLGTRLDFGSDNYNNIDDDDISLHDQTTTTGNDDADSGYYSNGTPRTSSGMASNPPDFEEALLNHGIRNLSLYCLGVALLQIGRWSASFNVDDVVTIRKLAAVNNRLGPRLQTLTQKCIECDFGNGFDLGSAQLQGAVYSSVICELENVIGALEKV